VGRIVIYNLYPKEKMCDNSAIVCKSLTQLNAVGRDVASACNAMGEAGAWVGECDTRLPDAEDQVRPVAGSMNYREVHGK